MSTCSQAAWDTRLSVHAETCDPSSVLVCLDDTEGCENFTTTLEFTAVEGNLYVIALGGYSEGDLGPATLTIDGEVGSGVGACCIIGECTQVTQAICQLDGGIWVGGACGSNTCNDGAGACCIIGECTQVTEAICQLDGGTWVGGACASDSCATGCLADLNGDLVIDGSDLTIMLGDWGGSGGDLNGSGITDGADLTILLGYWGDC